jgi:hypothetical protein
MGDEEGATDEKKRVIVLVHGIRTYAGWVPAIRQELENAGFIVEPTNYGYLDVIRFILPIPALHAGPINKVWNSIRTIKRQYPQAEINILAHSFGTYIVANILSREFDFKANRVVFCGSIISPAFPFNQILDRASWPILNEVGCRDVWPALANSATWGYGSTGTYGFRNPLVRDRWHRGYTHSQFLNTDFCKRFWVPFFRDGTIVGGDIEFEPPPPLLRFFSIIKIKYLLVMVAIAIGAFAFFSCDAIPSFDCATNTLPTDQAICKNCKLAAKDREIDLLFRRLLDAYPIGSERRDSIRREQGVWWSYNRANCGADVKCIADDYDGRIAQLRTVVAQPRR